MPQSYEITQSYKKYEPKELNKKIVESANVLVFDAQRVYPDELIMWEKKRVRTSSFHQGLIQWDSELKQYVEMYYGMTRPIGQLQYILVKE